MNGWIKLHRKILDNPIIKKPAYYTLWSVLLLLAQHKEQKIMWNKDILIIKEGQLITGRDKLKELTSIPETTIERILDYFEKNGHQIIQEKTTKFRLITIINWKEYQSNDNKRTTNGQQTDNKRTHTRMYKKDKNDKNKDIATQALPDINPLLDKFRNVNPSYKRLFSNKTERDALQRLINEHGYDKIAATIDILPKIIERPYAPRITTPYMLEKKLGELATFYKQEQLKVNKNKSRIIQ